MPDSPDTTPPMPGAEPPATPTEKRGHTWGTTIVTTIFTLFVLLEVVLPGFVVGYWSRYSARLESSPVLVRLIILFVIIPRKTGYYFPTVGRFYDWQMTLAAGAPSKWEYEP